MIDTRPLGIAALYRPAPAIRVGILSIAGALDGNVDEVEAALAGAGHTLARRFGHLQTRPGEDALRLEDVVEFLDLYGHEYALVAIRGWEGDAAAGIVGSRGAEGALVALAVERGCAVVWRPAEGDDVAAAEAAGATVIA